MKQNAVFLLIITFFTPFLFPRAVNRGVKTVVKEIVKENQNQPIYNFFVIKKDDLENFGPKIDTQNREKTENLARNDEFANLTSKPWQFKKIVGYGILGGGALLGLTAAHELLEINAALRTQSIGIYSDWASDLLAKRYSMFLEKAAYL